MFISASTVIQLMLTGVIVTGGLLFTESVRGDEFPDTIIGRRSVGHAPSRFEDRFAQPADSRQGDRSSVRQHADIEFIGHTLPETAADSKPGNADDDKRLSKIEKWIEKYQSGLDKKKIDAAKKPTFRINGRIHSDYWAFPRVTRGIGFFENPTASDPAFGVDPADRFVFRRLRIETRGDVFETMMYRFQIDFNNPAVAELKDAWIGFKKLPGNQELLVGNQKRPLGMDHLNSSRFNVFTERPLVVEAFNEDARRPGIAFYGNNEDQSWGWVYGGYLLENVVTDGRYRGDSAQASANARLFNSPWYEDEGRNYFHWAVAGMVAKPDGDAIPANANQNEGRFRTRASVRSTSRWLDTGRIRGADWYEILGLEGMLNVGPFQVVSEYQTTWMQRDNVTPGTGPDLYFQGAYVQISYFLTGEYIPYSRRSGTIGRAIPKQNFFLADRVCGRCSDGGWGAWQIALRYSYLDLTDADVTGGVENNVELAVNWYFTSHSKLQMAVIYGDIEKRGPIGGFDSGHFLLAGARLAVDF